MFASKAFISGVKRPLFFPPSIQRSSYLFEEWRSPYRVEKIKGRSTQDINALEAKVINAFLDKSLPVKVYNSKLLSAQLFHV